MAHITTNRQTNAHEDESALVSLARSGDEAAFTELMKRSESASKRLAMSILRDPEAAEDAIQDAVTQAWEHVPGFLGESRFSTWLSRIVFNQCLMYLRRSKRRSFVAIEDSGADENRPVLHLQHPSLDPERELGRSEMIAVVQEEVRRLPKLLREPLVLRDLEQRSLEDVAASLDISVAATKSRLLRARSELRERLQRHFGRMGLATFAT